MNRRSDKSKTCRFRGVHGLRFAAVLAALALLLHGAAASYGPWDAEDDLNEQRKPRPTKHKHQPLFTKSIPKRPHPTPVRLTASLLLCIQPSCFFRANRQGAARVPPVRQHILLEPAPGGQPSGLRHRPLALHRPMHRPVLHQQGGVRTRLQHQRVLRPRRPGAERRKRDVLRAEPPRPVLQLQHADHRAAGMVLDLPGMVCTAGPHLRVPVQQPRSRTSV